MGGWVQPPPPPPSHAPVPHREPLSNAKTLRTFTYTSPKRVCVLLTLS